MITGVLFSRLFDIYQLGLTLYRICNGNEAFNAEFSTFVVAGVLDRARFREAVLRSQFPDRRSFAPHIPSKLQNIVKKCLQPNPAERYQSAIDVANALASVDGCALDWRLNEMPDRRVWEKNNDGGVHYVFTVYGRALRVSKDDDRRPGAPRHGWLPACYFGDRYSRPTREILRMPKIKNDPSTHLRRSDLVSGGRLTPNAGAPQQPARSHERDFMTAPIDEALYIDFNPSSRLGLDQKNGKR
jgi:serine/threonine protein kinase